VNLITEGIIGPGHGHPFGAAERRVDGQNILTTEAIIAEVPDKDSGGAGVRNCLTCRA